MRSPADLPRRTIIAALAAITAGGLVDAAPDRVEGSGAVGTQTRPLAAFTGIALSLPAQVEVRTGPAESITIETNENLLPLIETVVEDGALRIRPLRRGMTLTARVLKMVVTARRIESMSLAGTGAISAASLHTRQLALQVTGAGSIALARLECESLAASIAGDGVIAVDGNAPEISASIAGAGKLRADRLQVRTANVSVIGSGEATVWTANELNASLVGAGAVRYYGSPVVHASSIGAGSVKRAGAAPS